MATTIAVIGDRFVRTEQLRNAVAEQVADLGGVSWITDEHEWPDAPMRHDQEVLEYTGDPAAVARLVAAADVAVVHMAAMHSRVLEAAPRLRCVACARAGAVNVNLDAARLRGITVTNAPGRNARAVAEFTIGALLAHTRGISAGHRDLSANGAWRTDLYHYESVGRLLPSLTVGIVGFGHVGRLVGQLLGALGCRLLASDPHIPAAVFANAGIDVVPLPRLLAESDVVTLHPRIEAGAPPLIGAAELATMRPDACLIQTARPAALDYDALADALAGGRLAGAVLDVYPDEPLLPTHPLLALPNVTLTPHIAGAARESAEEGAAVAARCVRQFLSGAPVEYPMQ